MCMNHQASSHLTFDANPLLSTSLPIASLSSLTPSMTNFLFLNRLCGPPSLLCQLLATSNEGCGPHCSSYSLPSCGCSTHSYSDVPQSGSGISLVTTALGESQTNHESVGTASPIILSLLFLQSKGSGFLYSYYI